MPEKFGAKQSAEAADLAQNFGPVRLPNESLNVALQPVAEIDINARACVSFFFFVILSEANGLAIVREDSSLRSE